MLQFKTKSGRLSPAFGGSGGTLYTQDLCCGSGCGLTGISGYVGTSSFASGTRNGAMVDIAFQSRVSLADCWRS